MKKLLKEKYESTKNNKFIVEFPENFQIPTASVISLTKPKYFLSKWENIEIVFSNLIAPSPSTGIYKIIEHYKNISFKDHIKVNIFSLDHIGNKVEQWEIVVKDVYVDFGNLDINNQDIQKTKMIIIPYNCFLKY